MFNRFKNRREAGKALALALEEYRSWNDTLILALPLDVWVDPFYGVGMWYENFSQTRDEEVQDLLASQPWTKTLGETS